MKTGIVLCLAVVGMVCCAAGAAIGQEAEVNEEAVYGEVLRVDADAGIMTVQYYDYDADMEKTVDLTVGKDATFTNASSLKDVKVGDWVDAAYTTDAQGKNSARTVLVEKLDEPEVTGPGAPEEEDLE